MGLGQPGPGFAYFLGASEETDHIQTRGLVDLFWRSCWHDFVSTLYEREADVKIMRSRCQGECEADVKTNAKPMSRRHSHAHTPNGSTRVHVSRETWMGTCPVRVGWERVPSELGREADIEKAFTRAHAEWKYTRTQTN